MKRLLSGLVGVVIGLLVLVLCDAIIGREIGRAASDMIVMLEAHGEEDNVLWHDQSQINRYGYHHIYWIMRTSTFMGDSFKKDPEEWTKDYEKSFSEGLDVLSGWALYKYISLHGDNWSDWEFSEGFQARFDKCHEKAPSSLARFADSFLLQLIFDYRKGRLFWGNYRC